MTPLPRLFWCLLALPLAGCMPTRPTPPPADVEGLTQALMDGHARAQIFLNGGQGIAQRAFQQAVVVLADPQARPADRLAAAQTVRDTGHRLDQRIVATRLQEDRIAQALPGAMAACQDPRPYLRTGQPPSLPACGRMRLAYVAWQQDRDAVHAARDQLQRQRGDAEAAVINAHVPIEPPQPYLAPASGTLKCVPVSGAVMAPAWPQAAL